MFEFLILFMQDLISHRKKLYYNISKLLRHLLFFLCFFFKLCIIKIAYVLDVQKKIKYINKEEWNS